MTPQAAFADKECPRSISIPLYTAALGFQSGLEFSAAADLKRKGFDAYVDRVRFYV
jgi:hypothetical protein